MNNGGKLDNRDRSFWARIFIGIPGESWESHYPAPFRIGGMNTQGRPGNPPHADHRPAHWRKRGASALQFPPDPIVTLLACPAHGPSSGAVTFSLAQRSKRWFTSPVIAVGRIIDPLLANSVLAEGRQTWWPMGRALNCRSVSSPKSREAKVRDIRHAWPAIIAGKRRRRIEPDIRLWR